MDTTKKYYGYIVVGACFSIWLIAWGTHGTFGIFYLPVMNEFGWSRADTVLAYSIGSIVISLMGIVFGWLTDKLGPRLVVTVFGSFLGIAYLLLSHVGSLLQFFIYFALIAPTGLSVTTTPIMSTIARWFKGKRGLMMGIVQSGVGIGGFIFPPLAGWIILNYNWRVAYATVGIIALAGIIFSGLFLRREPEGLSYTQEMEKASANAEAPKKQSKQFQGEGLSLWESLNTRQFWMIAGLYFIFGFCRNTILAHTAAHVQDVGYSITDGAHVIVIIFTSSMVGRLVLGYLADIFGNKPAFIMSSIATTTGLILILMTRHLWGFYVFAFAFGFGWGAQAVLRFSITSEVFGLISLGLVMGVLTIAEAVAAAFGSYFAGYMFDSAGSYNVAFSLGLGLSIAGIILTLVLNPVVETVKNVSG
ncbi:MFS transporter [Thermodesulfobacteriota bacterium]